MVSVDGDFPTPDNFLSAQTIWLGNAVDKEHTDFCIA